MKPLSTFAALLAAVVLFVNVPTVAQEKGKTAAAELTADSERALAALVAKVPLAKSLQPKATAILVFPSVKKAGLGIGGQYGEGTLLKGGKAAAFYKTTGASMGLQAGAQQVRLRAVPHEPRRGRAARRGEGVRSWRGAELRADR